MPAAPTVLRRSPVPLLPALAWVVLSVVRVGDVAVLLVALLVVGLVELVWLLRGVDDARVRQPALAAGALMGLALGVELGFAFGGGPGLALVSATVYLGARATFVATAIAVTGAARARTAVFAWRRVQVLGLLVSLVLWLVLLAGQQASATATGAVRLHGIRFELPGGSALLLALIAVSVAGEGVLQYQAHKATEAWIAGRDRRQSRRAPAPAAGARFLDDIDDDDVLAAIDDLEHGGLRLDAGDGRPPLHGPQVVPAEPS